MRVFSPSTPLQLVHCHRNSVAEYYVPQGRREFLHADERGSVIAVSDDAGAMTAWNRYDEYGKPAAGNYGLYGYTGQLSLNYSGVPELTDYKARTYLPRLGIFGQTDPIGYAGDGPNLYAYVLNDPVNFIDPFGLEGDEPSEPLPKNPCPTLNGTIICSAPSSNFVTNGWADTELGLSATFVRAPKTAMFVGNAGGHKGNKRAASQSAQPTPQDWCGNSSFNAPEGNWSNACKRHDECYSTLGMAKSTCDRNLFFDVYWQCRRAMATDGRVCVMIATTYYVAVSLGGGNSYAEGQRLARRNRRF